MPPLNKSCSAFTPCRVHSTRTRELPNNNTSCKFFEHIVFSTVNSELGMRCADSGHAGGVRVRHAVPDEEGGPWQVPVRRAEDHHLPPRTLHNEIRQMRAALITRNQYEHEERLCVRAGAAQPRDGTCGRRLGHVRALPLQARPLPQAALPQYALLPSTATRILVLLY